MFTIPTQSLLSPEQLKVWKSCIDFHTKLTSKHYRFSVLKGIQVPVFVMPDEKTLTAVQRLYWKSLQSLTRSCKLL